MRGRAQDRAGRWGLAGLVLAGLLGVSGPVRAGDGLTPDQARERMVLPEGFGAQVFASEPEIRQPVAACFDERGRMWVIEYLQYPTPAGLKPVSVDVYLRTEYDRIPEPPPRGPRGADRIKILEDTDGDGHADKVTTFLEGLNLASAVAVGHGGIFVVQAPYLLFYPDRDRDDRPDGDPEVLLAGFGLQDAHAVANSLAWGPDGWLYGAQGSTVTARIRGVEFQQGIWRYHPRTKQFELFAEGGGNTWGLDFDRQGQIFGSSNGGFIAFHMVQEGNYWKGFAKHGPLHNPRTYGYFDCLPYDGPKLGGHVTPGGIIYKGDAYPEAFRGAFVGGNLLSNAVYWHLLTPQKSSYTARHGGTLIDARDAWFRPIDLLTGPDGCVYVVDWYDRRASHLDPRDNWDRTNGRIYRITYNGTPAVRPGDLATWENDQLLALRTHPNDWYPEMARRILAERRDSRVIPQLKAWLDEDRDEAQALRDLSMLVVSGGFTPELAQALLDHPLPVVRSWAVRLLGDDRRLSPTLRDRLVRLAAEEPSPIVRGQLAGSCQRFDRGDALPILDRLLGRAEDTADPHIPLRLWWALEQHMRDDPAAVVRRIQPADVQARPLVRDFVLERAARALASAGDVASLRLCAGLLAASPDEAGTDRLVAGMDKGLEGQAIAEVPKELREAGATVLAGSKPSLVRWRWAARLGDPSAIDQLRRALVDPALAEPERVALIEWLAQARPADGAALLWGRFDATASRNERLAILNALSAFDDPRVAAGVVDRYPALDAGLKDRARDVLAGRPTWALVLIEAMRGGTIPAGDLKPTQARQIARLGRADVVGQLESVWGRVPAADSAAKTKRIAEVRGYLVEGDKGRADRGRAVFAKQCAGCHRLFGEGSAIGPDLTGSERHLDALLANIVDPSALIRKEYQAQTVAMKDGRVLSGLIVEETPATITLFDARQQKSLLRRDEIDAMKPAEVSLMPEGLLDPLPEEEVRDLFKYLQGNGPGT